MRATTERVVVAHDISTCSSGYARYDSGDGGN
jgi:hypothetical protein